MSILQRITLLKRLTTFKTGLTGDPVDFWCLTTLLISYPNELMECYNNY